MTVMQWIILINLAIKLYRDYKVSTATDKVKEMDVEIAIDLAKDRLDREVVENIEKVLGKDNENVPVLITLIRGAFKLFEKK